MDKKASGNVAEQYACYYLKNRGYRIIDRNYHVRYGELDIVCKKNGLLVFTEVKMRKSERYIDIVDTIDYRKEKVLIRSCEEYLSRQNLDCDYRIDFIGIVVNEGQISRFEHVKGII